MYEIKYFKSLIKPVKSHAAAIVISGNEKFNWSGIHWKVKRKTLSVTNVEKYLSENFFSWVKNFSSYLSIQIHVNAYIFIEYVYVQNSNIPCMLCYKFRLKRKKIFYFIYSHIYKCVF